jgi:enamine deaminase RidA (YjgF/YER057c/UK114 family)
MSKRISSGSETERLAAYSRAVEENGWIFVSGTIGIDSITGQLPPGAEAQAEAAFRIIEAALSVAGAGLKDVVRCGVFVVRREDIPAVASVLRLKFGDIRPANTTVICELPNPQALVEIEVTARAEKPIRVRS